MIKTPLKKTDLKLLLAMRAMIQMNLQNAETKRRAEKIKQVKQANLLIKVNSLESYISKALYASEQPLHTKDVILKIQELGWRSSSEYHKYGIVSKVLNKNYDLFLKVSPATFSLRNKVVNIPAKEEAAPIKVEKPLTSLKDIVATVVKKYQDEYSMCPSKVHFALTQSGFKCSYSAVRRAMQSEKLVRNGYAYKVV